MNASEKLKALREQKGMSQADCAKAMNIDRTTYAKYENGGSIRRNVEKLASFFNVSVDYLLGRTDEPDGTGFQKGLLGDADSLAEKAGRQDVVTASPPLTPDEIIHIKKYRALSDKGKQIIDMNLDQLKEIINNSKKE